MEGDADRVLVQWFQPRSAASGNTEGAHRGCFAFTWRECVYLDVKTRRTHGTGHTSAHMMEWQLESPAARAAVSLSLREFPPSCYIRAGQRLTHQITTPWASLSLGRERETRERRRGRGATQPAEPRGCGAVSNRFVLDTGFFLMHIWIGYLWQLMFEILVRADSNVSINKCHLVDTFV